MSSLLRGREDPTKTSIYLRVVRPDVAGRARGDTTVVGEHGQMLVSLLSHSVLFRNDGSAWANGSMVPNAAVTRSRHALVAADAVIGTLEVARVGAHHSYSGNHLALSRSGHGYITYHATVHPSRTVVCQEH